MKGGTSLSFFVIFAGEHLTDASKSAAVFSNFNKNGSVVDVLFVHKGNLDSKTCHKIADQNIRAAGGSPGWAELRTFLCQLVHNTGFSSSGMVKHDETHKD